MKISIGNISDKSFSSDDLQNIFRDVDKLQIIVIFILIFLLILYGPDYIKTGILVIILSLLFYIFMQNKPPENMSETSPEKPKIEDNSGDSDWPDTEIPDEIVREDMDYTRELSDCGKCQIENPYLWMSNPEYSTCYQPIQMGYYDLPENDQSYCNLGAYMGYDEANSRMSALRQRDKKTLDGWATKNMNFYKKHYGRELNQAENKRWWGNDEY